MPLTTLSGAAWSVGSCVAADARGGADWVSSGAGGALAGALVTGVKKQSLQGAFVGAVVFGLAAASTQWYQSMSPDVSQIEFKTVTDPAALHSVPTPASLGQSARVAQSLSSRLQ